MPTTAMLQAYYFRRWNGVYTTDFPNDPMVRFNYTGTPPNNTMVTNGTKMVVLSYNTTVELVLQGTSILGAENHPFHLHGYNFYVVGQGSGNFNSTTDPAMFNLVDPAERNTIGVPSGGWVAIRFRADNPGNGRAASKSEAATTAGGTSKMLTFPTVAIRPSILPFWI
ncbi:hypothetical protein L1987_29606 [Smallanthus sonchifolius]|uniref:Uncharacterized protein n=1 Tax=Smallanthus sonchifolius TaxID=185202 RepID=A0ACB9I296_9ASTR|nr:hypothetical protein L1987_29606 [Smallanthus sonchifolius]